MMVDGYGIEELTATAALTLILGWVLRYLAANIDAMREELPLLRRDLARVSAELARCEERCAGRDAVIEELRARVAALEAEHASLPAPPSHPAPPQPPTG